MQAGSVNCCLAVREPVRSGAGEQLQSSYFAFISTIGRVGAQEGGGRWNFRVSCIVAIELELGRSELGWKITMAVEHYWLDASFWT